MISPYGDTDSGDLFSLAWVPSLSTIYLGCQNTSIQWFTFTLELLQSIKDSTREDLATQSGLNPTCLKNALQEAGFGSGACTPRRAHKFFDSYPQYQRRPADLNARNSVRDSIPASPLTGVPTPPSNDDPCLFSQTIQPPLCSLQVSQNNVVWSAHYGYVYCMAVSPSLREGSDDSPVVKKDDIRLVTGSGDATIKVRLPILPMWMRPSHIGSILVVVTFFGDTDIPARVCLWSGSRPFYSRSRGHCVCWLPRWLCQGLGS